MSDDLFVDRTLRAFSDDLASAQPVPGGGAAAAYAGALGAALASMVLGVAARKADPNTYASLMAEANSLRAEFLQLLDEDTAAFAGVAAAMKLPRSTEEEKSLRRERMQAALVGASRVPMKMTQVGRRLLEVCEQALPAAGPTIVSDLGVGALLAESALRGAALNVMVNLAAITDAATVKSLSEELDRSLEGTDAQRRRITDFVESRIAR